METKIAKAFLRAGTFASRDDSRAGICGVRYDDGKLIATDGHRLIVIDLGCKPWPEAFTVPNAALYCLQSDRANVCEITEAGSFCGVVGMNPIPHIDESFPDWTRVLPESLDDGTAYGEGDRLESCTQDRVHVLDVNGEATVKAIVAAFACGKWNATDKLRAKVGKLKLPTIKRDVSVLLNGAVYVRADGTWAPEAARAVGFDVPADLDQFGEFRPPQWKPEGEYVQCNGKYVKDALEGAGQVRVQWTSQFDPVRIDRQDGESHVVMPLRHN